MVAIRPADMRLIDEIFGMEDGYLLNFSDKTITEFFDTELGIDIDDGKYAVNGTSKAKRTRTFIKIEDAYTVGQLLRKLWDHRASYGDRPESEETRNKDRLFALITKIETGQAAPALSGLSGTADVLSFDTVSRDLERALESAQRDPESAVTSACSTVESVCRSILIELDGDLPDKKDIKGLFNAIKKPLNLSADRADIDTQIAGDVRKILGGLATVVEGIGALRTHGGDAHGRERGYARIDPRIANLAINAASTVSLFLIETWQRKFPTRQLPSHPEDRPAE
jgi:hypothetical protein